MLNHSKSNHVITSSENQTRQKHDCNAHCIIVAYLNVMEVVMKLF